MEINILLLTLSFYAQVFQRDLDETRAAAQKGELEESQEWERPARKLNRAAPEFSSMQLLIITFP